MGRGIETGSGGGPLETEEPAVESRTAGFDVDLEPADVWTLGQLIEVNAVQFPPGVAGKIMGAYRILKASGYQPAAGEEPQHTDVALPEELDDPEAAPEDLETADPAPPTREVVVAEVTTKPQPDPPEGQTPDDELQPAVADLAEAFPRDELDSLSSAVEALTEQIDDAAWARKRASQKAKASEAADQQALRELVLDGALAGLATLVATLLAAAAALLSDPVFAVLALAPLGLAGLLAYPYMANPRVEGRP